MDKNRKKMGYLQGDGMMFRNFDDFRIILSMMFLVESDIDSYFLPTCQLVPLDTEKSIQMLDAANPWCPLVISDLVEAVCR